MTRIEDFDASRDARNIRAYEEAEALAIVERMAVNNALMSHPITQYVRRCPVEDCAMYPAISESYPSLYKLITGRKNRTESAVRKAELCDGPNMIWSLPGQDDRKKSSRCGVFRDSRGNMPLKMCMADPRDYIKAVGNHCGSLRCRSCMNYAAMNAGVRIEERLMTPSDIEGRKTGFYDRPKHWAISPPQNWMKRVCQRSDTYIGLLDDLIRLLPVYGLECGVIVFHPWRLSDDSARWLFSPHFHVVGYGMFENMALRNALIIADAKAGGIWHDDGKMESWVFNQIHAGEEMRSIRHTLGYIMTHAGIASFDHHVHWDLSVEDALIPAVTKGSKVWAKEIEPIQYHADWRSTGCYAEHPEDVDWTAFAMDAVKGELQSYRMFGDVNKVRTFSDYSEKVIRTCPVCGEQIGLFHNFMDCAPEPVNYNRSSKIRCMNDDLDLVREYWDENKDRFLDSGYTQLDFAMSIPQCSTPETKGVQAFETSATKDERQQRRDRRIVYVISHHGQGIEPKVVFSVEEKRMRAAGMIV